MKFKIKEITPEISELAGIFAADGSMQKNHICFWGNPASDKDLYDIHLTKLFLKAFNIKINPHEKESNSVYGFYICKKNIIKYFNQVLKFPIGKKTYSLNIPDIIYTSKDQRIVCSFIKGFFAGDGCLNFDKRYANDQKILKIIHTYPRLQIKSVSKKIIYQLSELLKRLKIKNFIYKYHNKKKNEADSYLLQISGISRLEKWSQIIGFSNKNHSTRYEMFKKYGFVPSNTAYSDRLAILKGKLDPWSFYPKWARSLAWIRRQKNRKKSVLSLEPSKLRN